MRSSLLALSAPLTFLALAACGTAPVDESGDSVAPAEDVVSADDPKLAVAGDLDGDGYTTTDCDDTNAAVHPGATESDNLTDDDCDGWVDEDFVAVGDIVVSEVNRQSRVGTTMAVANASWVEVHNTSNRTIDMANWVIARGITTGQQVYLDPATAPVVAPGDYAVFCDTNDYEGSATAAYPLTCDYVWGDESQGSTYAGTYHNNLFALQATSDRFAVYIGGNRSTGTLIDGVSWYYDATNGYWPRVTRFSMSLDSGYHDSTSNDSSAVWCATTANAAGTVSNNASWSWYDATLDDHGTPGAANYECQSLPDLDGDGYTGVDDCDDFDTSINPGATETCDGVDENCDGLIDNGTAGTDWYADLDGDSFGDPGGLVTSCQQPSADYVTDSTDCDDTSDQAFPGGTEVCDGLDNDCNGTADDGIATGSNVFYADADGDTFGDPDVSTTACTVPSGYSSDDQDCDDTDPATYPDAAEIDDGFDNDCDDWVDEDFVAVGDIVITEINRQSRMGGTVTQPNASWVEVYNTSSRTVDLSNWVIARGISSGQQVYVDPAAAPVLAPGDYAVFCDTDDYQGSAASWPLTCDYVWGDETQASTYQGTNHNNVFTLQNTSDRFALYLNGNRTTGTLIDSVTWYYDATNGYWPRSARFSMSLDAAYFDSAQNDNVSTWCSTSSSATGVVSYDSAWAWYDVASTSYDEYGTPGTTNYDCLNDPDLDGDGYTGATDCDDGDATVHPGATETCNGVDDNCDGTIDNDPADGTTWYADADADTYGDLATTDIACDQPTGFVADSTDCDDTNSAINPAATETCDGIDEDCDGTADNGAGPAWYPDLDGDTYGATASPTNACTQPSGYLADGSDCDDTDATINPLATETCDGVDEDCDGTIDDGAPGSVTYYADTDADGYGDSASTTLSCVAPSGYTADSTDCDDTDAATNPGATEVCNNGVDNDCNPDPTVCEWSGSDTAKADYDFRAYGTAANMSVGTAVDNRGDFDGDGYDDVVVGEAFRDVSTSGDAGGINLWYGPVDTNDALGTRDVSIDGSAANDQFGYALNFAGDVDGDGLDDLLGGAWKNGSTDGGAAYLFLGGTSPTSVSTAYATFSSTGTNNYCGYAVDGGDIDGDGRDDVLVTAYGRSSLAGGVGLWNATSISGAESLGTDATVLFTGTTAGDNLGWAGVVSEDLDGDGLADLVLGAPATASSTTPGKAYVIYGVNALSGTVAIATGADAIITGGTNGDRFGYAVAGVGDTDADGVNDFVVTADKQDSGGTDAGAAYLYVSAPTGSLTASSGAYSITTGEAASDFYGRNAAGVGDVNNDGFADVFLGATGYDSGSLSGAGAMYLWYGPLPSGTVSASTYDLRLTGANTSDAVGYAVGGGGDVNNDGFADFMGGAPSWDGFGYGNSGGSWVYYGRGE